YFRITHPIPTDIRQYQRPSRQNPGRENYLMASTTDDEVPDDASQNAAQAPRPKSGKAKRILAILPVMALAVIGYEGWHWFSFGRFHAETDDAYLQASLVILQARETGYISEVMVAPNAPVQKDQVIARIGPDDYRLALET